MSSAVVDASALTEYLLRTPRGRDMEGTITAADLHVPVLCDVEVAAALRRGLLSGKLDEERARQALRDLADLPLTRHGHQLLLDRVIDLRHDFSPYDAVCVALAERLGATLLTADARLARAVRAHLGIGVLQ